MSRLQIVHSLARLQCTKCGAEANASCNCGEPYVPAAIRVKEYDEANPGKSTRAAAADLGISKSEVGRARLSVVPDGTPETVTGLDGKTYRAKSTPRESIKKKSEKAIAAPQPIAEPEVITAAPPAETSDEQPAGFNFDKLKKQVADLAQHLERLTPGQAREIESLVEPLPGIVFEIIETDNKRKRRTKEAKNPQKALDDAREHEQHYAIDDDRAEAKREYRENGERWSDVKDDWEAEWLKDNWDDKREQEWTSSRMSGRATTARIFPVRISRRPAGVGNDRHPHLLTAPRPLHTPDRQHRF